VSIDCDVCRADAAIVLKVIACIDDAISCAQTIDVTEATSVSPRIFIDTPSFAIQTLGQAISIGTAIIVALVVALHVFCSLVLETWNLDQATDAALSTMYVAQFLFTMANGWASRVYNYPSMIDLVAYGAQLEWVQLRSLPLVAFRDAMSDCHPATEQTSAMLRRFVDVAGGWCASICWFLLLGCIAVLAHLHIDTVDQKPYLTATMSKRAPAWLLTVALISVAPLSLSSAQMLEVHTAKCSAVGALSLCVPLFLVFLCIYVARQASTRALLEPDFLAQYGCLFREFVHKRGAWLCKPVRLLAAISLHFAIGVCTTRGTVGSTGAVAVAAAASVLDAICCTLLQHVDLHAAIKDSVTHWLIAAYLVAASFAEDGNVLDQRVFIGLGTLAWIISASYAIFMSGVHWKMAIESAIESANAGKELQTKSQTEKMEAAENRDRAEGNRQQHGQGGSATLSANVTAKAMVELGTKRFDPKNFPAEPCGATSVAADGQSTGPNVSHAQQEVGAQVARELEHGEDSASGDRVNSCDFALALSMRVA
jgi:hypothetical protein